MVAVVVVRSTLRRGAQPSISSKAVSKDPHDVGLYAWQTHHMDPLVTCEVVSAS